MVKGGKAPRMIRVYFVDHHRQLSYLSFDSEEKAAKSAEFTIASERSPCGIQNPESSATTPPSNSRSKIWPGTALRRSGCELASADWLRFCKEHLHSSSLCLRV